MAALIGYQFTNLYENTKMDNLSKLKRKDLVYPELCYQIIGILFEIHKQLGSGYQERYYQRTIALELKRCGLKFKEQVSSPLNYKGIKIGNYFLDFLIDDKIILEIKRGERLAGKNIEQVFGYLKAFNLKLGIIANFTSKGLKFKRIVNIK